MGDCMRPDSRPNPTHTLLVSPKNSRPRHNHSLQHPQRSPILHPRRLHDNRVGIGSKNPITIYELCLEPQAGCAGYLRLLLQTRVNGTTKTALMPAKVIMLNEEPHILSVTREIKGSEKS